MLSKMSSLAIVGAGAYGASVAFNIGTTSKSAPAQPSLRGSSSVPTNSLTNTALTASAVFVAASAVAGKRTSRRGVQARAGADDEELLFQPGERVTLTGPPAMAGKQGSVVGPALGDAFAIRFDSGSVFNMEIHNIQGSGVAAPAAAAPAATTTYAAPAAVATRAASGDDEELLFQPGERVTLTGPPAMAGKQGTVVGPALGDAFAIRFDSGSVFNMEIHNIQGSGVAAPAAAAPAATTTYAAPAAVATRAASGDAEELEFQVGQKVEILGPPAMAGKRGEVLGPALSNAFSVRFESGSVFNIETVNLRALSMAMA